jgi:NAD(P)-dependent dehydrogenase (short-subunit alcohol dehydrogenase family)
MDDRIDLTGSNALVTGGGRGIGRATAMALAAAGARVVLCARSAEEVRSAAEEIEASTGNSVLAQTTDVADASDVERLAAVVQERWGRLDLLVNNAAVLGPVGTLTDVPVEEWLRALTTNVGSVAMVSRAMIPLMSRGGSIVNLSGGGIGGPAAQERVSAYVASKAAIVVLTEMLAREVATQGIRVNAVAPGAVATRFTEPILAAGPERAGTRTYEETVRQRSAPAHLDSFLRLVVWLGSDRSAWLSGRLLSARWDGVERLEGLRPALQDSSWLTLRRIDGDLFVPVSEPPATPPSSGATS